MKELTKEQQALIEKEAKHDVNKTFLSKRRDSFLNKASYMYGSSCDYSKVVYRGTNTKVCIICTIHGDFYKSPHNHLAGQGCPKCSGWLKERADLSNICLPNKTKAIPLTRGKYALVDEEDYEKAMAYNWFYVKNGYAHNNSVGRMHRFIMSIDSELDVDHENRNKLDNRKSNLRIATRRQNNGNSVGHKDSSSKFKGVVWDINRGKWVAQIGQNGRNVYLGRFDNEEDAARAYNESAKKYFGEFANLNIIS